MYTAEVGDGYVNVKDINTGQERRIYSVSGGKITGAQITGDDELTITSESNIGADAVAKYRISDGNRIGG